MATIEKPPCPDDSSDSTKTTWLGQITVNVGRELKVTFDNNGHSNYWCYHTGSQYPNISELFQVIRDGSNTTIICYPTPPSNNYQVQWMLTAFEENNIVNLDPKFVDSRVARSPGGEVSYMSKSVEEMSIAKDKVDLTLTEAAAVTVSGDKDENLGIQYQQFQWCDAPSGDGCFGLSFTAHNRTYYLAPDTTSSPTHIRIGQTAQYPFRKHDPHILCWTAINSALK